MSTYSDFPDVKISTSMESVRADAAELTDYEARLCLILIMMCLYSEEHNGRIYHAIDMDGARTALESFGYSEYESTPMLWSALEEVAK